MEVGVKKKDNFFEFKESLAIVKHEILKWYLNAWFPTLHNNIHKFDRYNQLLYVDGFAGPGKYEDGAFGSPVLALRIALNNNRIKLREGGPKLKLIFIDIDKNYCEKLKLELQETRHLCIANGSAKNDELVQFEVLHGTFKEQMAKILVNNGITKKTPLLVFADPFGYSGDIIHMELMREIFNVSNKSEIFINIMDGFANRHFGVDESADAINSLLGFQNKLEWRNVVFSAGPESDKTPKAAAARREAFINLYIAQLFKKPVGARRSSKNQGLKFGMKNNKNRHTYHLVFFTHNKKGIKQMKRAMAKQSLENENFVFSEFLRDKGYAKNEIERWSLVKELILEKFRKTKKLTGKKMIDFVWMETIYIWNFVKNAKDDFKDIIIKADKKFENVVFDFTKYVSNSNDSGTQIAGSSNKRSKKHPKTSPAKKSKRK